MTKLATVFLLILSSSLQQAKKAEDPQQKANKQRPREIHEVVVVTDTTLQQPLLETTSYSDVITRQELDTQPATVLDDHLRRIPGFSLFRRSSSMTAHPTTQGVSLRGIGPSGASRSLVLFDGLPINDPFGGWVYWNRLPLLALQQIEVVRGASSQLYGSSAMGGTIQLLSQRPESNRFDLRGQLSNPELYDLEAQVMGRSGKLGYLLSGRIHDGEGFYTVAEEQRGAVDERANLEFESFFGKVYYGKTHVGVNLYSDRRGNGTPIQRNNSRVQLIEGGYTSEFLDMNVYLQSSLLESTFSRIIAGRDQEFKTAQQRFESVGVGSSLVWTPGAQLAIGFDWRYASWNGNRQNLAGIFFQDLVRLSPRVDWLLGIRGDLWQNRGTRFAASPRTGIFFRATPQVSLRGSVYQGFRAPTLNELYRPFRVGNVVTTANDGLRAERLAGFEGGLDIKLAQRGLVRVNGFWNRLKKPVGNVTIAVTPSLITRQRANIEEGASIRGLETEALLWINRWEFRASYIFSSARLRETGLRLPQVPYHQGLLEASYVGQFRVTADARWTSSQFDDDLNQFPLGGFVVFDLRASRALAEQLELFVSAQNILDRRFATRATPIERIGEGRLVQGGIRLSFGFGN